MAKQSDKAAKKPDAAERIAATVSVELICFYPRYWNGDKAVKKLARRIRAAIKAERVRCVRVIHGYKDDISTKPLEQYVCDDLIALINPPKPKNKGGKR